jgi:hypothetical protein
VPMGVQAELGHCNGRGDGEVTVVVKGSNACHLQSSER